MTLYEDRHDDQHEYEYDRMHDEAPPAPSRRKDPDVFDPGPQSIESGIQRFRRIGV